MPLKSKGSPSKGKKGGSGEAKFYESLQNAEARQLESFLKQRSIALDEEIAASKARLAGVTTEIETISRSGGRGGSMGMTGKLEVP
jgi:hypothetical protein